MSGEIKEGDGLEVSREITVGGKLAFNEGEVVTVEKIDPNRDRPQYMYVVKSPSLGKRLQLRAEDLRPVAGEEVETPGPAEAAPAPAEAPAPTGKARAAGFARRRKWLIVTLAALLAAAGATAALILLPGGNGANEALTANTRKLKTVIQSAGSSSTSLSSEIGDAVRQAPTPEEFAPLGGSIADKYVPSFQEYSSRISEIRRAVSNVKPSPRIEYSRSRLLAACDAYGEAMRGYVKALEQLSKSRLTEATQTLQDVKRFIDNGNSLIGGS